MQASLFLALILVSPASADVIALRNGVTMKGIVAQAQPDGVDLRVDEEGTVFLDSGTVLTVTFQTAKENAALEAGWKADRKKFREEAAEKERLDEAKRAKGLSFYEGEWLSAKELDHRLAAKSLDLDTAPRYGRAFVPHEAAQPALPAYASGWDHQGSLFYNGGSGVLVVTPASARRRVERFDYTPRGALSGLKGMFSVESSWVATRQSRLSE